MLTAEDCDGFDASLLAQAKDNDCDGLLTAEDCDNLRPILPVCLYTGIQMIVVL